MTGSTAPSSPASEWDRRLMQAAIALARRHLGATRPNPSVGAIVVAQGDPPHVLGRGVTAPGGRPHAEPQALLQAGSAARDATLYSTLEPCSHHGKTPPCVDAIIAAGIARVVVAVLDPDPRVAGRGCRFLTEAGIAVTTGVETAAAEAGLAGFLTHRRLGRPHVTLKLAIGAGGVIGQRSLARAPITGPLALATAQMMRTEVDAILVGIGTAIADDPRLTVRLPGLEARSPLRIVLDSEARLPPGAALFAGVDQHPLIVVVGGGAPSIRVRALRDAGAQVIEAAREPGGRIDLADALRVLGLYGIMSVLVEGGAVLAQSLLDADLVDRFVRFDAPTAIGSEPVLAPDALIAPPPAAPVGFVMAAPPRLLGPDRLTVFDRRRSNG